MSTSMILKLMLVIHTVYARLELCDIHMLQERADLIPGELTINSGGPLNLLRGYIMCKSGYMHNKRFFSQGIDTDYSLKKSDKLKENIHVYTYTRNPENDKSYKNMIRSRFNSRYTFELHQQMIYMFPCENNTLSIEPCRNDSFTWFLRAHDSKLDTSHLLAALLLLSEGIDVPIKIEKNIKGAERIFLKSWTGEFVFIDLSLWIESNIPGNAGEKVYQKETESIVEFFQRLRMEPFLSDLQKCNMPKTQEHLNKGYFLESPQFLIQSYIFEYIDNVDQYRLFVAAVRVLLLDLELYPGRTENQKKYFKKTLDYCFIEKKLYKSSEDNYTTDILSLKSKIDKSAILPFTSPAMVPLYTHVPEHIPENSAGSIQDGPLQYSNHVETMLLSLFTCLTYNPEINKCSTMHMPGASLGLKAFFNKYTVPTESASQTKHRDWCWIVSKLNNSNIKYARESRTELCGGLANILYVISELFVENNDVVAAIENVTSIPYNEGSESERIESIKRLFLNILNYLAGNHQIRIKLSALEYLPAVGRTFDIFGSITLSFEADNREESIRLDIHPKYSKFSLVSEFSDYSEDARTELMQIIRNYSFMESYIGRIIRNYLNNNIKRLEKKTPEQNQSTLNTMLDRNVLNKIFLWGRIDSLEYKASIVRYFFINRGKIRKLHTDNQLLRIIRNIIGSVSLGNLVERKKILISCMCCFNYNEYFTKIEYDPKEFLTAAEFNNNDVWGLLGDIIDISSSEEIFNDSLCNLLSHSIFFKRVVNIFGAYTSFNAFCIRLIKVHGFDAPQNVMKCMKEEIEAYNARGLAHVWFLWLLYACAEPLSNLRLIKSIYMYLEPTYISCEYISDAKDIKNIDFNHVLSVLEAKKYLLGIEENEVSKAKYEKTISDIKKCSLLVSSKQLLTNPNTARKRSHLGNQA
ncbi:hypothetical protein NEIG_02534 [Nematocida sp. ERTm5]|nr:hypothetical protein NEIG_02534 [Nematocida sp. ERTm5]